MRAPLVEVGQVVARGEAIALSGYSGLDALVTFPFGAPHVHFNTWLNGEPVDPFPHGGNASLWRGGALPEPSPEGAVDEGAKADAFVPSIYSEARVSEAIAACKTADAREELGRVVSLPLRAARTLVEMNYYPTRFPHRPNLYAELHPRAPRLDLPFSAAQFRRRRVRGRSLAASRLSGVFDQAPRSLDECAHRSCGCQQFGQALSFCTREETRAVHLRSRRKSESRA